MRSLVLGAVGAAVLVASCTPAPSEKELTLPSGIVVRWTPSAPLMADLVKVQAVVPGETDQRPTIEPGTTDAGVPALMPLQTVREPGRTRYLWSFRIKRPGPWSWAPGGPALWTVASVAGKAQKLKTLGAQALWSGKGKP